MGDWDHRSALARFEDELSQAREKLDALERKALAIRRRNSARNERAARTSGADAPRPDLIHRSRYDIEREVKLRAEVSALALALRASSYRQSGLASPSADDVRRTLKAGRDSTDGEVLYEDEVRIFIRARNKTIGKLLFWIDEQAGPDPCALADWGRGGEYVSDEVVLRAIEEGRGWTPSKIVEGSRPPDPEFAQDALRRAYDRIEDTRRTRRARVPLTQEQRRERRWAERLKKKQREVDVNLARMHIDYATDKARAQSDLPLRDEFFDALACRPCGAKNAVNPEAYADVWAEACGDAAREYRAQCGRDPRAYDNKLLRDIEEYALDLQQE